MELLFTEINFESNGFHDFDIGNLLKEYCAFHKIYIGEANVDFTITWNNFHKFYSLSLFEAQESKNKRGHFDKVVELLKKNHIVSCSDFTWRWDRSTVPPKNIPGNKYTIYPYKGENCERFNGVCFSS